MSKGKMYLIFLTPLKRYFFGNEKTFGEGNEVNYYARSNRFPAQTSVLGMLRFELLKQNDMLKSVRGNLVINDKEKAKEFIGESGFSITGNNKFGKIYSLSPVILSDGNNFFYLSSKEHGIISNNKSAEEIGEIVPVDNPGTINGFFNHQSPQNSGLLFRNFEPKMGFYEHLRGINNSRMTKNLSDIFIRYSQVGILKNRQTNNDERGFYKQDSWGLKTGYSFAFFAELSDDIKLSSNIVKIGGEKSMFNMVVSDGSDMYTKLFQEETSFENGSTYKLVLLSDTYSDASLYSLCSHVLTETSDFRYIKTRVDDTKNYSEEPRKSSKLNLLKRGSVLFTSEPAGLTGKIVSEIPFRNIGYNYFKINRI